MSDDDKQNGEKKDRVKCQEMARGKGNSYNLKFIGQGRFH